MDRKTSLKRTEVPTGGGRCVQELFYNLGKMTAHFTKSLCVRPVTLTCAVACVLVDIIRAALTDVLV